MNLVVDASVALKWFFREREGEADIEVKVGGIRLAGGNLMHVEVQGNLVEGDNLEPGLFLCLALRRQACLRLSPLPLQTLRLALRHQAFFFGLPTQPLQSLRLALRRQPRPANCRRGWPSRAPLRRGRSGHS